MNKKEINQFIEQLRYISKLEFPKYQKPSITKEGLIESDEKYKIFFENGEYYNIYTKILYLNNDEIFEGKINKGKKYNLVEGTYRWQSGQIFKGKFLDDNRYEGEIKFEDGKTFKGTFNNELEFLGEFRLNEKEFIKGNFKRGNINDGRVIIQKNRYYIEADFKKSKIEGLIKKLNIDLQNHKYIFPSFTFENDKILEDKLTLKKDGKKIILNKLDFPTNKKRVKITGDELNKLNDCLNICDDLIPKIEIPYLSKIELIIESDNEDLSLIFKDGIKANFDEDNTSYKIELANGETFNGMLDDDNNGKYWLKEGIYSWPSGQEYNGAFNKSNQLNSMDAELKMKNTWSFKGSFVNGNLEGHGKFEWNGTNYYLDGYFSNGILSGNISLSWSNINMSEIRKDSSINEFEAKFDNQTFKIQKININNILNDNVLFIEQNENNYFLGLYSVNNGKIKIENFEYMEQSEKDLIIQFLKTINNDISIPDFQPFSIKSNKLIPQDPTTDENEIYFKYGITYNKETKVLSLQNNEKFIGVLNIDNHKYTLEVGEYIWPSGQKYLGNFNEKNNFEGNSKLIMENKNKWEFRGVFQNGAPNGYGELFWENGDYIKGNFNNGKILGMAYIKMNNNVFEGIYINSIIKESFNNIYITNKNKNYKISKISINKGIINEDFFDLVEDNGNKIKIRLDNNNKKLLSEEDYRQVYFNENDLISLFKFISKIRRINLSFVSPITIYEGELNFNLDNNNNNKQIKLTFPNNDIFKGTIEKIDGKYFLVEGEYEWPSGQKYTGKFDQNKLDSDNAQLEFKNGWTYEGSFKKGYIEGNGKFKNKNNELIEGYFEKGEIKRKVIIKKEDYDFEGDYIDSINELYIETFEGKKDGHTYEINKFKMTDKKIEVKRDGVKYYIDITNNLRAKMIESLLIKVKPSNQKFYYNEPYKKESSNENKIKMLKIQDNIHSMELSKLSIYCNRLKDKNRSTKGKIGEIIGINIGEEISFNELITKLRGTYRINNTDQRNLQKTSRNLYVLNENSKDNKDIEFNEIIKICNSKMIKDMKDEIYLINKDISTLKKEKEINELEKNNKMKEFNDLNLYYKLLNNNYNELINDKVKMEEDEKVIEEDSKNIIVKNNHMTKFLNNLKNNWRKNNKNGINKTIKELDDENNKILEEIKEKEEIINSENREKEELLKTIKYLEGLIEKQK